MQKFGYDPIEELVKLAQDPNASGETKYGVAGVLLPYMYPKLSSVMMEAEVTTNDTVETQNYFMRRILENPELADAAQRISLAAADALLERDLGVSHGSNMLQ
jgi:hypothetical protein